MDSTLHSFYGEVYSLFDTLSRVAYFCLLVALIVLVGAAIAWFRANTPTRQSARIK